MTGTLDRHPKTCTQDRRPLIGSCTRRRHAPSRLLAALLVLLALVLAPIPMVRAAGGADSTCTQASIQSDLNAGGTWTLDCGGSPAAIPFSTPVTFSGGTAALQVAAGKRVILDGGHNTQLFVITGGTLSLSGLTLQFGSANGASFPGNVGGAIVNNGGKLSVSGSNFVFNSAPNGGGAIENKGGSLSVSGSTFADNSTDAGYGGAIFNLGGSLNVSSSTFSGNSAPNGGGGAIANDSDRLYVSISTSTFAGNSAGAGYGGAIFNLGGSLSSLSVSGSTFAGNSAPSGNGGAIANNSGSLSVNDTIIANNTCAAINGAALSDGGYNLEWQGGGALTCGFTAHAVNNQDPLLGPLQDNGGPTPTMALGAGSPAIDVVPLVSCVDAFGAPLVTDQRGLRRPDDGEAACDSGAYEAGAAVPILFSDSFESGDFAAWTTVATNAGGVAVVQSDLVKSGRFAARLSATSQPGSYAYARKTFTPAQTYLSASGDVRVLAEGASGSTVPIFRLFDPSGALLASLYRANHSNGQLWVQRAGAYRRTSGALPLNTWAHLEIYVATVGANQSTLEVRLNGALVYRNRGLNLGTDGVQTVQIGNEAHQQVFDLVADNIVVQ